MQTTIDDETLVAFLDGELPAERASAVEQSLHADKELRLRLQKLRASWDLLSELPEETLNPDLARSTIEMVTVALQRETQPWWARLLGRRWLMLGLLMLTLLAAGSLTGAVMARRVESRLLVELPAVATMPLLENIDRPAWLELLTSKDELREAGEFLIEQKQASAGPKLLGDSAIPETVHEREMWVKDLEKAELGILKENMQEYGRTPAERQDQLRRITQFMYADRKQFDAVIDTIHAYQALLDDRNTPYLTWFMGLSLPEREATIDELIAGALCQKYATNMPPSDKSAIEDWLTDLQIENQLFGLSNIEDFGERVIEELFSDELFGNLVTEISLDALREDLSAQASELLGRVPDDADRRRYIGLWVMSAFGRSTALTNSATPEQLQQQFEKLRPAERFKLELMPEKKAREELGRRIDSVRAGGGNTPNTSLPTLPLSEIRS